MTMHCYCEPQYASDFCYVWKTTIRRAKKEHKCCECFEVIKVGEQYEYIFSIFEDQVIDYKTCLFCSKEFERLNAKHGYEVVKGELACMLVEELRYQP